MVPLYTSVQHACSKIEVDIDIHTHTLIHDVQVYTHHPTHHVLHTSLNAVWVPAYFFRRAQSPDSMLSLRSFTISNTSDFTCSNSTLVRRSGGVE